MARSITDFALRFQEINQSINGSKSSNTVNKEDLIAETLTNGIQSYLKKASATFLKVVKMSDDELVIRDGRIFYHQDLPLPEANYENAYEVTEIAIKTINEALQIMSSNGVNKKYAMRLGAALATLYIIYDNVEEWEKEYIKEKEKEEALRRANDETSKAKCLEELQELAKEIDEYNRENANKFASYSIEDFVKEESEGNIPLDQKIPLGNKVAALDNDFVDFLDKYVKTPLPNLGESVSLDKEHPCIFIDATDDLLSRDYFDQYLRNIIFESYIHFKPNNLQIIGIENKENEPVLKPIFDSISKNASSSLCYEKEVATDQSSTDALLDRLIDETNNRISRFKEFSAISSNGRCDDIYDYNNENSNNPIPFIFFIYKDYPKFINDESHKKMMIKIIDSGARVGIFTLIVGQNINIKGRYSGDKEIEKLDLESLDTLLIKVETKSKVLIGDTNFKFLSPSMKINYVTLMKKRLESAKKFFLDSILEEKKENEPYYDRIKIPVGETGGRILYYESSTESKPSPFSVITGQSRSGKTAFVHSLIMSAAYKYSPQEVEIHLVDFKAADKSTDFDGYRYVKGEENLYIPHVKYLSLKSRPENAIDVTNYIIKLMAERSKLGKFREYNRNAKPEDRVPQIYVIIDEYENMIKGGDGLDENSIEKTNIVSQINTNLTTILKRAAVFGIGVIFAGQDFTLKQQAKNQINNRYAFYNSQSTLSDCFPQYNGKFDAFPSDVTQSQGYLYFGSDADPRFARAAYAGEVSGERMHKLAKRIREKWQSFTDQHIQTIIGGMGYVVPEPGCYKDWEEEINDLSLMNEMSYESKEDYISSGAKEAIKSLRPLTIGQSASSQGMISLKYRKDTEAVGYYGFASKLGLCRIESNLMMSFLYKTKDKKYTNSRIIFLDASYDGVKEEVIDNYVNEHPFIKSSIEYVRGNRNIAVRLLEIEKDLLKNHTLPYLVILHGVDFLDNDSAKEWIKVVEEVKPVDKKDNDALQKEREELEKKANIQTSAFLSKFMASATLSLNKEAPKEEKKSEIKSFTISDVHAAIKNLYLKGSRNEIFCFIGSENYPALKKNFLDKLVEQKDLLAKCAVFGSFEMYKKKMKDDIPNANIAYVINADGASTTRLFNYLPEAAMPWWDDLEKRFTK